jgi:hypothetical protein
MHVTLRRAHAKEGIVARFCSPLGQYPLGTHGAHDAGYLFDPEAVITVARFSKLPTLEDYYSEMEWAHPEEIRLFASLALAHDREEAAIILYPLPLSFLVDTTPSAPLHDPGLLNVVKTLMVEATRKERRRRRNAWYFRATTYPPFISRARYEDCGSAFVKERHEQLYSAIDPGDFLLVRGLSTWLRSAMLARHNLFLEEAITTLFISLEASYRLVLRRLKGSGHANPGAKEAAEFIGSVFNEAPLERYFSEYYDSRVKAFHPENRFGIFPHAPLMVDDYYHLHESMRELYVYLVIGYVESKYPEREAFVASEA